MLGVPASSHDGSGALADEGTLSRQLHTAPLPAPHVPVGYLRWNAGFLYALALEQSFRRPRVARHATSSLRSSLSARTGRSFDFTPYFEVFFTSSNVRRPCSMSLSTSGAMPKIAAFSNRLRRSLTRASRAALPFCQLSLASGLTRPSPPQNSHARSIGRHPRSLQAIPKPAFAPRQSGQITVNMANLLFCARFPAGAGRLFCCAPITH